MEIINLPQRLRKLAWTRQHEYNKYYEQTFSKSRIITDNLRDAFNWANTKEGFKFWLDVENGIFPSEFLEPWQPKEGDRVLVSGMKDGTYHERIYIGTVGSFEKHHVCVLESNVAYYEAKRSYLTSTWAFIKPLEEPINITGVEITIDEIAKWKGVKPELIKIKK